MIAEWVLEGWEKVSAKTIVRSFVSSGLTKPSDYSVEDQKRFGLDAMKIDANIRDVLQDDYSEAEVSAILASNAEFQQDLNQHAQLLNPEISLDEEDVYNFQPASGAANLDSVIGEEEDFLNSILQYVDENGNML